MSHNGYTCGEYALHTFENLFTTFELDGISARLLHDADGGGKSLLRVALIGAEGHIHHHEGTAYSTHNRSGIHNHLVERDRKGGLVSLHHVGSTVSNKDDIYLGAFEERSHRVVVGRKHGNLFATQFHALQHTCGYLGNISLQVCHSFIFLFNQ